MWRTLIFILVLIGMNFSLINIANVLGAKVGILDISIILGILFAVPNSIVMTLGFKFIAKEFNDDFKKPKRKKIKPAEYSWDTHDGSTVKCYKYVYPPLCEAVQLSKGNAEDVLKWLGQYGRRMSGREFLTVIITLDQKNASDFALDGSWIIKMPTGDLDFNTPAIFSLLDFQFQERFIPAKGIAIPGKVSECQITRKKRKGLPADSSL
jgi:hypothetical protein